MPAAAAPSLLPLALPPGAEFVAAIEEAWQRGDAVLPLDPAAPPEVNARIVGALRPDLPVEPGTALVIATSGSTGDPKGVVLDHAALAASADATRARIGHDADDRWLSCLPWHHIAGLQVWLRARRAGVALTVHERFEVERFRDETEATLVSLVPTQLTRLLDAGIDLGRFRVILLGGAPPPAALLERARATGANVVVTYGMSETCGGCVYDGLPLDGVAANVDDRRRIWLRGPMLMRGYRLDPQRSAAALVGGWFRTDDLGAFDAGRLVVRGRADDVIVTGGEKVAAAAVEQAIASHADVVEAAVVGVPDAEWGERIVAVVVVRTDEPGLADALRSLVRNRVGANAVPKSVLVVEALPQLASGKTDRLAVRTLALDLTVSDET